MPIINHVPELVKKRKFPRKRRANLRKVQHETGLEYSTVARWMKGAVTRADWPVLEAWCKYLECEVGELLEYRSEG